MLRRWAVCCCSRRTGSGTEPSAGASVTEGSARGDCASGESEEEDLSPDDNLHVVPASILDVHKMYLYDVFRVVRDVSRETELVKCEPEFVVACLGRHLFLSQPRKSRKPMSMSNFFERELCCVRLSLENSEVRVARPRDPGVVADAEAHLGRLLLVRGEKLSSYDGDSEELTLLLQAPEPRVCSLWAEAWSHYVRPWPFLLISGRKDEQLSTWLYRLVDAVQDLQKSSAASGSSNPARVSARGHLPGTSALRELNRLALPHDKGLAIRLMRLVVLAGALSELAGDHTVIPLPLVHLCWRFVQDLLEFIARAMTGTADFFLFFKEELCSLLGRTEATLGEIEVVSFYRLHKKEVICKLRSDLGELHAVLAEYRSKAASMKGHARAARILDDLQVAAMLPSDMASSATYDIKYDAPHPVAGYVPGIHNPGRFECNVLLLLQQYEANEGVTAPRMVIYGIGGVGKSLGCMGVAACSYVRQRFFRGTMWVQLGTDSTERSLWEAVLELSLRIGGADKASRLRQLDAGCDFVQCMQLAAAQMHSVSWDEAANWLVVVDDVPFAESALLKYFLLVVPAASPVLITTRSEAVAGSLPGFTQISVDFLPAMDARLLLANALGRPTTPGESPFSVEEESTWVARVVTLCQCHALSLAIAASVIAGKGGAWRPVLSALEERSKDVSFDVAAPSVRATLDTSLCLLRGEQSRSAFAALGVLPSTTNVGVMVLSRLWRPWLDGDGGKSLPAGHAQGGAVRVDAGGGVDELVDELIRAGLLRSSVSDGRRSSVSLHPVVQNYARALLGEDYSATHARLLDDYMKDVDCLGPGDGLPSYAVEKVCDDGYIYDNVARHGAACENVGVLVSLLKPSWRLQRVRTSSLMAYQSDVEKIVAALLKVVDDADHDVLSLPAAVVSIHVALGHAFVMRVSGSRPENMENALSNYEKALAVSAREDAPLAWAETQRCLGEAYRDRVYGDTAANVEAAIGCHLLALEVFTREAAPVDWATTQQNLGKAYSDRVGGDRAANLEEAISCYRRALEVFKREAAPVDWATTQQNLGDAYCGRVCGDRADNLEAAILCHELALEVHTREAAPLEWARTQQSLGDAYSDRVRGDRADNLEEAIKCHRLALEVFTRDAVPLEWAKTQPSLGYAYFNRVRGDRADNVEAAIRCYRLALEVFTREAAPLSWATTQQSLGNAYRDRVRGDKLANVEAAMECHRLALEVFTREAVPLEWARTQQSLGYAYFNRMRGDRADNLEAAIKCHNLALEVHTREAAPLEWARTQQSLGDAYSDRVRGDRADNVEAAVRCYRLALEVFTREAAPLSWATTQQSLGNAYRDRVRGDRADNLEAAMKCDYLALEHLGHARAS